MLQLDLHVAAGSACCSWICMLQLDLHVAAGSVLAVNYLCITDRSAQVTKH